jgi:hypothetical protein
VVSSVGAICRRGSGRGHNGGAVRRAGGVPR